MTIQQKTSGLQKLTLVSSLTKVQVKEVFNVLDKLRYTVTIPDSDTKIKID